MKKLFFVCTLTLVQTLALAQVDSTTGLTNGNPVYLEFTKATITPPVGYKFMPEISSFIDRTTESSISVIRNDSVSYYLVVGSMLRTNYEAQNIVLLNKEELAGTHGMIFTFLFNIHDIPVERMVYVTGNENFSIMVSANYKQSDKATLMAMLRTSILSVTF